MEDDDGDREDEDKGQKECSTDPVDGRFRDVVVGRGVIGNRSKSEPLQ